MEGPAGAGGQGAVGTARLRIVEAQLIILRSFKSTSALKLRTFPPGGKGPTAAPAHGDKREPVGMLTSDVALLHDAKYLDIVLDFSKNPKALDHAFQHAWYKLTSRDMGPHRRSCIQFSPALLPNSRHPLVIQVHWSLGAAPPTLAILPDSSIKAGHPARL